MSPAGLRGVLTAAVISVAFWIFLGFVGYVVWKAVAG